MPAYSPAMESAVVTSWRVPPLLKASMVGHGVAATAVWVAPSMWPWALGAFVLDHAVITAVGLWPRSTWLGSNMCSLPQASVARSEVSITIDDGPNPQVTPAVLDILEKHGARATFFCIAQHAEKYPALCREMVSRGHSVQNHGHAHAHSFSLWGPKAMARDIGLAQDRLSQITGEAPLFFRAPAGLRNLFLDRVLHRLGLSLVSWTRRGLDTFKTDPELVQARLARGLAAGDILLLHDGHAAVSCRGRAVILDALPGLLNRCQQAGLRCVTLPQAVSITPQHACP